jgi:hypothetical protein
MRQRGRAALQRRVKPQSVRALAPEGVGVGAVPTGLGSISSGLTPDLRLGLLSAAPPGLDRGRGWSGCGGGTDPLKPKDGLNGPPLLTVKVQNQTAAWNGGRPIFRSCLGLPVLVLGRLRGFVVVLLFVDLLAVLVFFLVSLLLFLLG